MSVNENLHGLAAGVFLAKTLPLCPTEGHRDAMMNAARKLGAQELRILAALVGGSRSERRAQHKETRQ